MGKDSNNPEILDNAVSVHIKIRVMGWRGGEGIEVCGERMRPGRGMKGKFRQAFSWPGPPWP